MSDDDNSDDDFNLPCLHILRTKCKFSSDEDDEPDDLKRALRQIQHQKIDVSRVKSIAKVQERERDVDDLLDNRSQDVSPEIESNSVISLHIEAENSSISQLSCGERVFDIDKFQCVFRLEDVTLLSSGYRALQNLSKLERRLLDESSSWMLQNLSQILLICRPHNITNYSAFLLYLLRVASVCDSLLLMHCIEENIENFLKEVRRTFKASISIVDIFKIFINFGLIVEPYCPSKYLKTVYIHLKNNAALKDRGDKPKTPRTAHWFSNLNTIVSILDQLLPHCDFEDRDWLQMFLVLLWTCMDETLTHLEIKSTSKNCLHTIIEKFSTKFLNSGVKHILEMIFVEVPGFRDGSWSRSLETGLPALLSFHKHFIDLNFLCQSYLEALFRSMLEDAREQKKISTAVAGLGDTKNYFCLLELIRTIPMYSDKGKRIKQVSSYKVLCTMLKIGGQLRDNGMHYTNLIYIIKRFHDHLCLCTTDTWSLELDVMISLIDHCSGYYPQPILKDHMKRLNIMLKRCKMRLKNVEIKEHFERMSARLRGFVFKEMLVNLPFELQEQSPVEETETHTSDQCEAHISSPDSECSKRMAVKRTKSDSAFNHCKKPCHTFEMSDNFNVDDAKADEASEMPMKVEDTIISNCTTRDNKSSTDAKLDESVNCFGNGNTMHVEDTIISKPPAPVIHGSNDLCNKADAQSSNLLSSFAIDETGENQLQEGMLISDPEFPTSSEVCGNGYLPSVESSSHRRMNMLSYSKVIEENAVDGDSARKIHNFSHLSNKECASNKNSVLSFVDMKQRNIGDNGTLFREDGPTQDPNLQTEAPVPSKACKDKNTIVLTDSTSENKYSTAAECCHGQNVDIADEEILVNEHTEPIVSTDLQNKQYSAPSDLQKVCSMKDVSDNGCSTTEVPPSFVCFDNLDTRVCLSYPDSTSSVPIEIEIESTGDGEFLTDPGTTLSQSERSLSSDSHDLKQAMHSNKLVENCHPPPVVSAIIPHQINATEEPSDKSVNINNICDIEAKDNSIHIRSTSDATPLLNSILVLLPERQVTEILHDKQAEGAGNAHVSNCGDNYAPLVEDHDHQNSSAIDVVCTDDHAPSNKISVDRVQCCSSLNDIPLMTDGIHMNSAIPFQTKQKQVCDDDSEKMHTSCTETLSHRKVDFVPQGIEDLITKVKGTIVEAYNTLQTFVSEPCPEHHLAWDQILSASPCSSINTAPAISVNPNCSTCQNKQTTFASNCAHSHDLCGTVFPATVEDATHESNSLQTSNFTTDTDLKSEVLMIQTNKTETVASPCIANNQISDVLIESDPAIEEMEISARDSYTISSSPSNQLLSVDIPQISESLIPSTSSSLSTDASLQIHESLTSTLSLFNADAGLQISKSLTSPPPPLNDDASLPISESLISTSSFNDDASLRISESLTLKTDMSSLNTDASLQISESLTSPPNTDASLQISESLTSPPNTDASLQISESLTSPPNTDASLQISESLTSPPPPLLNDGASLPISESLISTSSFNDGANLQISKSLTLKTTASSLNADASLQTSESMPLLLSPSLFNDGSSLQTSESLTSSSYSTPRGQLKIAVAAPQSHSSFDSLDAQLSNISPDVLQPVFDFLPNKLANAEVDSGIKIPSTYDETTEVQSSTSEELQADSSMVHGKLPVASVNVDSMMCDPVEMEIAGAVNPLSIENTEMQSSANEEHQAVSNMVYEVSPIACIKVQSVTLNPIKMEIEDAVNPSSDLLLTSGVANTKMQSSASEDYQVDSSMVDEEVPFMSSKVKLETLDPVNTEITGSSEPSNLATESSLCLQLLSHQVPRVDVTDTIGSIISSPLSKRELINKSPEKMAVQSKETYRNPVSFNVRANPPRTTFVADTEGMQVVKAIVAEAQILNTPLCVPDGSSSFKPLLTTDQLCIESLSSNTDISFMSAAPTVESKLSHSDFSQNQCLPYSTFQLNTKFQIPNTLFSHPSLNFPSVPETMKSLAQAKEYAERLTSSFSQLSKIVSSAVENNSSSGQQNKTEVSRLVRTREVRTTKEMTPEIQTLNNQLCNLDTSVSFGPVATTGQSIASSFCDGIPNSNLSTSCIPVTSTSQSGSSYADSSHNQSHVAHSVFQSVTQFQSLGGLFKHPPFSTASEAEKAVAQTNKYTTNLLQKPAIVSSAVEEGSAGSHQGMMAESSSPSFNDSLNQGQDAKSASPPNVEGSPCPVLVSSNSSPVVITVSSDDDEVIFEHTQRNGIIFID